MVLFFFELIFFNSQKIMIADRFQCSKRNCTVGEMVFDGGCRLAGQNCGINMIFVMHTRGTIFASNTEYCYQRCSCQNGEFVENNLQCEKKDEFHSANGIYQIDFIEVTLIYYNF